MNLPFNTLHGDTHCVCCVGWGGVTWPGLPWAGPPLHRGRPLVEGHPGGRLSMMKGSPRMQPSFRLHCGVRESHGMGCTWDGMYMGWGEGRQEGLGSMWGVACKVRRHTVQW